jgi:hypothetical protein
MLLTLTVYKRMPEVIDRKSFTIRATRPVDGFKNRGRHHKLSMHYE